MVVVDVVDDDYDVGGGGDGVDFDDIAAEVHVGTGNDLKYNIVRSDEENGGWNMNCHNNNVGFHHPPLIGKRMRCYRSYLERGRQQ